VGSVFTVLLDFLSFLCCRHPVSLLGMAEHPNTCSSKAIVVGHSFVRRLGTYLCHGDIGLQGHTVEFRGFPGSSMHSVRRLALGWDLSKFCVVYVELGTDDLCGSRSAEADVRYLLDLGSL